jgi:hypothetical protein
VSGPEADVSQRSAATGTAEPPQLTAERVSAGTRQPPWLPAAAHPDDAWGAHGAAVCGPTGMSSRPCSTPRPLGPPVRARGNNWSTAADIRCRQGGSRGAARPGRAGQVGLTRGPRPTPACLVHEVGPADPGLRTVVSRLRRIRARGRFGSTFFGGNMGTGSGVVRNSGPEGFRRVPCRRDVSRETSPSLVHCLTLFMGGHRMGRVGDDERSPG